MKNAELAHKWAGKTMSSGKASNYYFEGDTIYSWGSHFPIARHLDDKSVLFTLATYSNSTTEHKRFTLQAISHKNIIYVPNLKNDKESNFKYWIDQIENNIIRLETARKKEKYLQAIEDIYKQVKSYCDYFKFQIPQEITRLANVTSEEEYVQYLQERREQLEKERREKKEQNLREWNIRIQEWKDFKTKELTFNGWTVEGFTYLRYDKETEKIETSKGIPVSLGVARHFWDYIYNIILTNPLGNWHCDYKILGYKVNEINKDYIKVGCHTIQMSEILSMVKILGF